MALAVATADDVSNEVTMSAAGAYLTCRAKLTMAVARGKADFAFGGVEV